MKFFKLWWARSKQCCTTKKCYKGDNQCSEGLAVRTSEKPVPHKGREDHAGHHHQDDADTGVHVVCQRQKEAEEREQAGIQGERPGRK